MARRHAALRSVRLAPVPNRAPWPAPALRKALPAVLLLAATAALAEPPGLRTIEILGNSRLSEGFRHEWVAVLAERPLETSADGYRPGIRTAVDDPTPLPTDWERPLEFRWSFGDGSGWISTGERPTVAHLFPDDGDFTLTVEAWHDGLLWARGTKELEVRNGRPRYPLLAATEIDPETSTFELTADVDDAPDDEIRFEWDFGDGETSGEWERWRTTHSYRAPGTYTVTVRISDDDEPDNVREESTEVFVAGAGTIEPDSVEQLEEPPAGAVQSGLRARVDGSFELDFAGEIRPTAGLYLAPTDGGRRCRFLFTAWDDAHLTHMAFVADLPGRPEPGGTQYTLRRPRFWINFDPTAERYEKLSKRVAFAGIPGGSLGQHPLLSGLGDALDPELRQQVGNQAGYEPGEPVAPPEPGSAAPAVSPFGIEDHEGFKASGGTVELTFVPHDRAVGSFEVELRNADEDSPYPVVTMKGDFALDLRTARRDGIVLYDRCAPSDFAIEEVAPKDGTRHLVSATPRVAVDFSERFAVETLDESTFQLTYPAAGSEEPVAVPARLFRKRNVVYLEPEQELLGGVRYTARVRTGDDGVRSRGGVPLEDADGTGWFTWSFTTMVDFVPGPGDENLSCHVFQSVRDAPLIADKPAVARIYADWKRHPEVDSSAQVEEFSARVLLMRDGGEIASVHHRFVHPDFWAARGIRPQRADHTANVFWTPQAGGPGSLRVALEVPKGPDEPDAITYWTRCATPRWALAPELEIRWYVVEAGPWWDPSGSEGIEAAERLVAGMLDDARTFLLQSFPLKDVSFRFGGRLGSTGIPRGPLVCDNDCAARLLEEARSQWDDGRTHVAIAFVPHIESGGIIQDVSGGGARIRLAPGRPGLVVLAVGPKHEHRGRYLHAIVHELGHVLDLDHLPYISDVFQQAESGRVRGLEERPENRPTLWYGGIEGFRIALDGRTGWNKSSTEGNEQGDWLTALMYPSSIPLDEAFIARHHYLGLMETWEGLGGLPAP